MIEIQVLPHLLVHLDGIQGVAFDLDDTLYSEKSYVQSGFRAVAELFPDWPECYHALWNAFSLGLPAIDTVLTAAGRMSEKEACLRCYREHTPTLQPYPPVDALLQALSDRHIRLGLITDGRPEGQRAKIRALGLEPYFDPMIITDELGGPAFRKPNETAFRLLQRQWELPFSAIAYVGDNIAKDFIAPERLGMRAIWFRNPDGLYQ